MEISNSRDENILLPTTYFSAFLQARDPKQHPNLLLNLIFPLNSINVLLLARVILCFNAYLCPLCSSCDYAIHGCLIRRYFRTMIFLAACSPRLPQPRLDLQRLCLRVARVSNLYQINENMGDLPFFACLVADFFVSAAFFLDFFCFPSK